MTYRHRVHPRPAAAQPPLRRDAERNRVRILEAARRLIAENGLQVSHDEIAREADVAVGTVYRRYPTKHDLFEALFTDRVHEVVEVARHASEVADPWDGLVGFLTQILELQAADRGLQELLTGTGHQLELAAHARREIAPIVTSLMCRAQDAGVLRADVRQTDIALIPIMVGAVIDGGRGVAPDVWRRALAVVLDGLRAEGFAALPAPPPTPDEFDLILSSRGRPTA